MRKTLGEKDLFVNKKIQGLAIYDIYGIQTRTAEMKLAKVDGTAGDMDKLMAEKLKTSMENCHMLIH